MRRDMAMLTDDSKAGFTAFTEALVNDLCDYVFGKWKKWQFCYDIGYNIVRLAI